MAWDIEDTICAIATGNSGSLRGVVRISGPRCLQLLLQSHEVVRVDDRCGRLKSLKTARRFPGQVDLGAPLGLVHCDFWIWPNSRSYTGQPSIEVHTIGCQPILEALLARLIAAGAKLAAPGEFTLRAFLAGRVDLAKAEAVLGVIHAQSQRGLDVALKQLAGGMALPVAESRRRLIELVADIEAGLDFVDEDITFISHEQVLERLEATQVEVTALLEQLSRRGTGGLYPRVVIAGKPNAGKSSLVNALTGKQLAIVSSQAGTTRDTITAHLQTDFGTLELFDTAGLEQVSDPGPRKLAQAMAQQALREAELVLFCIDAGSDSATVASQWEQAKRLTESTEVWVVWTKVDLVETVPTQHLFGLHAIEVSCQIESSLQRLRDALGAWHSARNDEAAGILPMTAGRCRAALQQCSQAIQQATLLTQASAGQELVAAEIRLALDLLGQVAGEVVTDDILDALFSRFCIGK